MARLYPPRILRGHLRFRFPEEPQPRREGRPGDRQGNHCHHAHSLAKKRESRSRSHLALCCSRQRSLPAEIETPIPTKTTPPLTDLAQWTRASGKTFRGRLLGLHDEKAYFRTDAGRTLVVPMKGVDADDQKRIRDAVTKEMKKKKKDTETVGGRADPFTD